MGPLRRWQLAMTVPHEVGHWVDFRHWVLGPLRVNSGAEAVDHPRYEALIDRWCARPEQEREEFAFRYAVPLQERLLAWLEQTGGCDSHRRIAARRARVADGRCVGPGEPRGPQQRPHGRSPQVWACDPARPWSRRLVTGRREMCQPGARDSGPAALWPIGRGKLLVGVDQPRRPAVGVASAWIAPVVRAGINVRIATEAAAWATSDHAPNRAWCRTRWVTAIAAGDLQRLDERVGLEGLPADA